MTAIRFQHVSKWYPRYHQLLCGVKASLVRLPETVRSLRRQRLLALDDVSFEIEQGETVGVIGPNGSGKSTALGLIAGVLAAQAGQVEVHGRVCPLLELGAGFHPELSGRENIVLNGVLLGLTRREVLARLDEIVAFSGLAEFLDQPIRTYSSGMLARLGFSVAVHVTADILLIDEVLAVGDTAFSRKCTEEVASLKDRGKTIVFVSHDLGTVEQWCDKAIYLDRGRVRRLGPPPEVVDAYVRDLETQRSRERDARARPRAPGGQDDYRWGSGEIEITSCRLLTAAGEETHVFEQGEDIRVEIGFTAHVAVRNAVFGIGVFSQAGVPCFGFNTHLDRHVLDVAQGAGVIRVTLNRVPLQAGEYLVEVAASQVDLHGHYLDLDYVSWRARRFAFTIRQVRPTGRGVMTLAHSWEFEGVQLGNRGLGRQDLSRGDRERMGRGGRRGTE
ncbi:ABC transporter ATP-binding protein [Nitrospira sp. Kam-Ns4a]